MTRPLETGDTKMKSLLSILAPLAIPLFTSCAPEESSLDGPACLTDAERWEGTYCGMISKVGAPSDSRLIKILVAMPAAYEPWAIRHLDQTMSSWTFEKSSLCRFAVLKEGDQVIDERRYRVTTVFDRHGLSVGYQIWADPGMGKSLRIIPNEEKSEVSYSYSQSMAGSTVSYKGTLVKNDSSCAQP